MGHFENIDYVVGEEKRLIELLSGSDVMPLLQASCRAGASRVEIRDAEQAVLWEYGLSGHASKAGGHGFVTEQQDLVCEGEMIGQLWMLAPESAIEGLHAIAVLVGGALNTVLTSNFKRMLTAEIHTQVINQSFDDLLATNARLVESERNYRELAEDLENRVGQHAAEFKQAYAGLVAQQQMASVGQLAAGVAHEINNPLGFIHGNLQSLRTHFERMVEMLQFYRLHAGCAPVLTTEGEALWKKLKLEFILEDLDSLFSESIDRANRVQSIVSDLKSFSHVDTTGREKLQLDAELELALTLLAHEMPHDCQVRRNYQLLTPATCCRGQLRQVLLNLLRNAMQSREEGLILELATGVDGDAVWVSVADNGCGIPEKQRRKVFEPFFTTRPLGSGFGLGLTVVQNILAEWGGEVVLEERPGGGTLVRVSWPRNQDDDQVREPV